MKRIVFAVLVLTAGCGERLPDNQVRVAQGVVEGVSAAVPGVRAFLGIPYGAAPVGALRWKAPEPAPAWEGVRVADAFGDRCVQTNPFPDMLFQSAAESEDCLSLSVWTPATTGDALPVMVWIHGGGYFAGAGDEQRHDGSMLASKGVVLVTINYRLGVLGFLSHPELTAESAHEASGNYGLVDQILALQWVRDNIAAFGGDPGNVTIFGESAGSLAVSALMASPVARGLFHKAIGESGAHFSGQMGMLSLDSAEAVGVTLANETGGNGLAGLRALPAESLVAASVAMQLRSWPMVDGYVLPSSVWDVFERGEQSHVPLLAGWNSAEIKWLPPVNAAGLAAQLREAYPDDYEAAREFYPASTDREAWLSAIALRSERFFVAFGAWKWIELHATTGGAPVYRYLFDQVIPTETGPPADDDPGAGHATDIEYVFETLDTKSLAWRDEDRQVADRMATWWTSFAKTGDPNGPDLPPWPAFDPNGERQVMVINASPTAAPEPQRDRARFEFMDRVETREHRVNR